MFNALKDFFGIPQDHTRGQEDVEYVEYYPAQGVGDDQDYVNSSMPNNQPELTQISAPSNHNHTKQEMKLNNVIGMPGLANGNSEVIVIEPSSFEEMAQVITALRERKSVVLNLNIMNSEDAQRAVDFVAGGTYAMDGHQERVGEGIFLFTPSSVKVSSLTQVLRDVPTPETHIRRSMSHLDGRGQQRDAIAQ